MTPDAELERGSTGLKKDRVCEGGLIGKLMHIRVDRHEGKNIPSSALL